MPDPNLDASFIVPDWPAPANVRAFISTRIGGVSKAPFDSMNMGDHVGDDSKDVILNRQMLAQQCGIPLSNLHWLRQVHGTKVHQINGESVSSSNAVEADASSSRIARAACVIMTADCLPILFCNMQGTHVAAAHAGWRGLAEGVVESTLASFDVGDRIMAYLGPAISQAHFEVGDEVKHKFEQQNPAHAQAFKTSVHPGKFMCDLYAIARTTLADHGVTDVYGGDVCTYADKERFFSYRRDGSASGRMASVIFLGN